MTTQEDLEKYLAMKKIDEYVFHYIYYDSDIINLIDLVTTTKIKHNIVMLMSEKNNHWVYVYYRDKMVYYFDSYGCIPNMYQLIDLFDTTPFNELYEIRKKILQSFRKKLRKDIKFYYNDYIFQKNVFGILQGDINDRPTSTCGEFCVTAATFLDKYDKFSPDLYILTAFNRFQSEKGGTYDELVKDIVKIKF